MPKIVLIAHNLRSTHNVGSLLRTAEGLGVETVYLTGYTPYPATARDNRLAHIRNKVDSAIQKTALGAEKSQRWEHAEEPNAVINHLRDNGYQIIGLEQHSKSQRLPDFKTDRSVALLLGRETEGLEPDVLSLCDKLVEIPMFGKKESFNVVQAAAMALYHIKFFT